MFEHATDKRARRCVSILLLGFAALLRATAVHAACPDSHYAFYGAITLEQTTAAPVWSDSYFEHPGGVGTIRATIQFDIPQATLSASVVSLGGIGSLGSALDVTDDFQVVGLAPGTPVALAAVATFEGFMVAAGGISDAFGNHAETTQHAPHFIELVSLPVAAVAGQEFRITFHESVASPTDQSSIQAMFSFTGIPPGCTVTSCKGYLSGSAVGAPNTTWGRVRAIYR